MYTVVLDTNDGEVSVTQDDLGNVEFKKEGTTIGTSYCCILITQCDMARRTFEKFMTSQK